MKLGGRINTGSQAATTEVLRWEKEEIMRIRGPFDIVE